jgi:hypothetical protein
MREETLIKSSNSSNAIIKAHYHEFDEGIHHKNLSNLGQSGLG